MNYRHIYHAGNFCDIIKHLTLIAVLKNLLKKSKPFAVLDCFAGTGMYDTESIEASKTNESMTGIKKLMANHKALADTPELLNDFLKIINTSGNKNHYPGSPLIIKKLLRPIDRLIACELHAYDYESLKRVISDAHKLDAYEALKAFLPFKEKRGLVFLDPAFEVKNEFDKLVNALKLIRQRAENICSLIWFPIKNQAYISNFYNDCKVAAVGKEIMRIEFSLKQKIAAPLYDGDLADNKFYMNSCGLLIVNPPNIHQELTDNTNYLIKEIYKNEANITIDLL